MNPRLSATLVSGAVAVLALVSLALLARNILAIPALVPLDPNEGWNAAHALAAMAGHGVRPVRQVALDEIWSALRFRPA